MIGIVSYINALPFTLGLLQQKASLVLDVPTKLNAALTAGSLDVALTSSAAYLDGDYELIPGYGIAAHKQILSVNLYTSTPLSAITRIGVTSHSATSVSLLRVLCTHLWQITPTFVPLEEESEAFLLIGDEPLKKQHIAGYKTIDLAAAWHEMTGLPFVFATLVKQKGAQVSEELFDKALLWSAAHHEEVIGAAKTQSGLDEALIRKYYDLCIYRLTENEHKGLSLFKELRDVSKVGA